MIILLSLVVYYWSLASSVVPTYYTSWMAGKIFSEFLHGRRINTFIFSESWKIRSTPCSCTILNVIYCTVQIKILSVPRSFFISIIQRGYSCFFTSSRYSPFTLFLYDLSDFDMYNKYFSLTVYQMSAVFNFHYRKARFLPSSFSSSRSIRIQFTSFQREELPCPMDFCGHKCWFSYSVWDYSRKSS